MIQKKSKNMLRKKKHTKIRKKLIGTFLKPRISVFRSLKYMYIQLVDDEKQKTLLSLHSKNFQKKNNIESATFLGERLASLVLNKGFKKVVFDRSGYLYHGRIKALAEAARKKGLLF